MSEELQHNPAPDESAADAASEIEALAAGAPPANDAEQQMRRMSRRSFAWSILAFGAAGGGLQWLNTRREEDGVPWPLRRALQTNESLARDLFSPARLAPTFPRSALTPQRVNGVIGMSEDFNPEQWQLTVEGVAENDPLTLDMAAIKKLPRFEMITELKCIEGWSVITHWAGARMADFIARYPPTTRSGEAYNAAKPNDLPEFVGMETPDGGYYVGLEREAALHPQTLLCYEMSGAALTLEHGAPLRLVTPLKYGVKHIKRIGTIRYVAQRPADYWAEQGYDWYAGH